MNEDQHDEHRSKLEVNQSTPSDLFNLNVSDQNLLKLLEVAEKAALAAGELIVEKWDKPLHLTSKGPRDTVTDADIASQKLITDTIRKYFPNDGFLTEEGDNNLPQKRRVTWIIDPIDGTINYSRHQSIFTISIAVAFDNHLKIGLVYDPLHNELFSAASGAGFFVNKRKYLVSPVIDLTQAIVGFDWDHGHLLRQKNLDILSHLIHEVRTVSVLGSAALSLAWIAAGRLDGYFKLNLDPWDVGAGAVLIQEAGGTVSHNSGQVWDWQSDNKTCIASNGHIHSNLVDIIRRTATS